MQYGSISQSNKIEFRGPSWMIEPDIIWRDMFKFTQDRLYAIKRTQTELVVVAGTIIPMRPRMRIEELFRGSLNQEEDGSERSESVSSQQTTQQFSILRDPFGRPTQISMCQRSLDMGGLEAFFSTR